MDAEGRFSYESSSSSVMSWMLGPNAPFCNALWTQLGSHLSYSHSAVIYVDIYQESGSVAQGYNLWGWGRGEVEVAQITRLLGRLVRNIERFRT